MSRKPDHEPRTWCPQCGAVCTESSSDDGWIVFHAIKEPTIGTYTEPEIVKVFADRDRWESVAMLLAEALIREGEESETGSLMLGSVKALSAFHTAKGE